MENTGLSSKIRHKYLIWTVDIVGSQWIATDLVIVGVDDESDHSSKNVDERHQGNAYVQSTKHTCNSNMTLNRDKQNS